MAKIKSNRRVHHRARMAAHQGRITARGEGLPDPFPVGLAWLCDDPACLHGGGIHQLFTAAGESASVQRERPGATNPGPFSDTSDSTSEGAAGGQHTDK